MNKKRKANNRFPVRHESANYGKYYIREWPTPTLVGGENRFQVVERLGKNKAFGWMNIKAHKHYRTKRGAEKKIRFLIEFDQRLAESLKGASYGYKIKDCN